jgi:arylformamidase
MAEPGHDRRTTMRAIDVSMPLFGGMPSFPGDPPFSSEPVLRIARGDPYNLSRLSLGSHAGTHLDVPRHFDDAGAPTEGLDLGLLNGPCEVVRVAPAGLVLDADDLPPLRRGTTRVLLRTPNSERWARRLEFFDDYVALGLGAARRLVRGGVRLVGIDSLSIESDRSEAYPVHRELLGRGVVVLEGLLLGGAPPGRYELRCLPLAIRGGDGGPARAVLTPLARSRRRQ